MMQPKWAILLAALICVGQLSAQDLTEMTLDFNNITGTNVNQTVGEQSGNEKEVEFGDYDNDGDYDVVIAVGNEDFGQRRNKLYRNDNGVLNEVSGNPVIPGFANTDTSRNAFFRDYNNDGLLDIIIVNDSNSGTGNNNAPGKTKLYLQNGSGVFVNTSQNLANQTGAACNGVSEDFDGNGLYDLMMCNYPGISQDSLGFNGINGNPAGQFTVVTNTNYPSELEYGVHAEAADMNGDGKIDFLTANWTGDDSFIYYNDNNNAGSGLGDFRYSGTGASSTFPSIGGGDERAMVPCDFNGDGMMDMYFANRGGGTGNRSDFLFINTGNDNFNRATFTTQQMPNDQNSETHKITCRDLDGDGKDEMIVMSFNNRPYIYRNVSTTNDVRFIEWTPSNITIAHDGWQGKAEDITGNGRPDVLFGANSNDHLFENVESAVTEFDTLNNGALPGFHNSSPIAITGMIAGGETLTFSANLPNNARISVLARSETDLGIDVIRNGSNIASLDRVGDGITEGVQFVTPGSGNVFFELTNNAKALLLGDINGDGVFNLLDVDPFVGLLSGGMYNPAGDFDGNGVVNLLDVTPFVDGLANGGGEAVSSPFIIEFLGR